MKFSILPAIAFVVSMSGAEAAVQSFVPGGLSTVGQNSSLFFDVLSDQTSTSNVFGPTAIELSDHGDFHFDSSVFAFVSDGVAGGGTNLAPGTVIDASSAFDTSFIGFAGTNDFSGTCAIGTALSCIYGFSFMNAGNTHFGWVEFIEGPSDQTLLGWAYETTAGAAILAGQGGISAVPVPAGLPLLASGFLAMGVVARRKRLAKS
jgi:hypothetical protein